MQWQRGGGYRNKYFCQTNAEKYYTLPTYFRSGDSVDVTNNKMYRTKLERMSDRLNEISYRLEFVMMSVEARQRLEKELKELIEQREYYIETMGKGQGIPPLPPRIYVPI